MIVRPVAIGHPHTHRERANRRRHTADDTARVESHPRWQRAANHRPGRAGRPTRYGQGLLIRLPVLDRSQRARRNLQRRRRDGDRHRLRVGTIDPPGILRLHDRRRRAPRGGRARNRSRERIQRQPLRKRARYDRPGRGAQEAADRRRQLIRDAHLRCGRRRKRDDEGRCADGQRERRGGGIRRPGWVVGGDAQHAGFDLGRHAQHGSGRLVKDEAGRQRRIHQLPDARRGAAGAGQRLRVILAQDAVRKRGRRNLQVSLARRQPIVARQRVRGVGIHGGDVGAQIGAVGRRVAVRARRAQVIVAARVVDKAGLPRRHSRKEVAGRITRRGAARKHVTGHHTAGEVGVDRRQADAEARARNPVGVVRRDVVGDDRVRRRSGRRRAAAVKPDISGVRRDDGVVVHRHDVGSVADRERSRAGAPGRAGEIIHHIVPHRHVVGALARREIVGAEDIHAAGGVADQVVLKRDALGDHPRCMPVLIARRDHDGIAALVGDPDVLEHVAFDQHVLRILQLEGVLDRPLRRLRWRAGRPRAAGVGEVGVRGLPVDVLRAGGASVDDVVFGPHDRRPRDRDASGRPGCDRGGHFGGRGGVCFVRLTRAHARDDLVKVGAGGKRTAARHPDRGNGRRRRDNRIAPGERLAQIVATEGDVGGDEVLNHRIGAAKQHVLGRTFEVVVLDQIIAGAVEAAHRLGILANRLAVGHIGIQNARVAAVEGDAALLAENRIAMHVDPVEHQRVRHLCELGLRRIAGAERDDVAVAALVRLELEKQQLPVVGRSRRPQRGHAVGRSNLRQPHRVGR